MPQAQPVPLLPDKPGISKRATKLAIGNRWIDCDKIVFVDGLPEKMPGWNKLTTESVGAAIRGLKFWSTLTLAPFFGFGTYRKLYIADQSLAPVDITPVEDSGTLTDPFTVTAGFSTVTVEHTLHSRKIGDEVRFANASAVGNITIDGTYLITSIIDENHYTIEHSASATYPETGGGNVAYEYDLSIGDTDPLEGDGFGAGAYGLGNYGEPTEDASGSIIFDPRIWNLDNYGDLLVANPVGGGIYVFDPNEPPAYQRAELLHNAPTSCRSIFVTLERFLFALGVDNDPMRIKWPDQDDITNWTPGEESTANDRRLQEGTRLIGGRSVANGLTAIWSDTALYAFQYTGNQFVYNSTLKGKNCGLVSPMAVVVHLGVAYWMSRNNFHYWSGGAPASIPNSEDIREFVVRKLRRSGFEFKCHALYSARYNAIFWFYAPVGSTEPGLYVAVFLTDFSWVVGTMNRTSGTQGMDLRPVMAAEDGYLYQHEDGLNADGDVMPAFITRAPMQILQGAQLGEVQGIVNDMQRQSGAIAVRIDTYDRINDGVLESEENFFDPGESLIDFRVSGRIAEITLRSTELDGDFRLGAPVLEVKATGSRR